MTEKFDIIINGGGFAGLTLAAGAAKLGLNIAIIEPQAIENIQKSVDGRTTALSYFSRKFYEALGLWNKISESAGSIDDIKIFDADYVKGDSLLRLNFSKKDVAAQVGENSPMGHIVENGKLKSAFIEHCLAQKNIKFFEKETITFFEQNANHAIVDLSGDVRLQAKLIVAADGKNSPLREMIGIETFNKDYDQTAITFNLFHEIPHNRTAIERFLPTGPFAALPMFDAHASSIVWTVEKNVAPLLLNMNVVDLKEQIHKRLGDIFGDFKLISKPNAYPLTLKYVKKYYEGRCVLIADSAHSIHPLAGQGFNQGVKDIALLLELINENIMVGLDIGSTEILERYEKERAADNGQMIFATDLFNMLFSNDNKIISLGRRLGIAGVDIAKPIKRFFIKRAMGA